MKYENPIVGEVDAQPIGQNTTGISASWQKLLASLPGTYFLVTTDDGNGVILREELFTEHFRQERTPANA